MIKYMIENMKELGIVAFLVVVIISLIFLPFAFIWALNTLFSLNIEYSFWTWLAVVVLNMFLQSNVTVSQK